ncbi:uncharacterized protein F4822DRAFT_410223 [Hypoxylon trugodes]|uniref:uncharacterized protein n=1 Tax=Hypoxylon trugodes TaxID=326681 RepID=UPI00219B24E5|nr:uncharacterized protein F4822DRAFT_410223 [Hypoxylon trugodes]KAI1386481.1 hypothetical protein F4822DRAFT_410223 [Hypoxylon trugodes]
MACRVCAFLAQLKSTLSLPIYYPFYYYLEAYECVGSCSIKPTLSRLIPKLGRLLINVITIIAGGGCWCKRGVPRYDRPLGK